MSLVIKMVPGKVRKSFLKRFKITKNKILRRKSGVNHFRIKKDKDLIREKRNFEEGDKKLIEYAYY